jgi:ketosteroid isomerase-like protein
MSSTDIQTIRQGYEAFAQLDIDKVVERFAPDMTWTVPPVGEWGGTVKGVDEIVAFFGALPARYGPFAVVPDEFLSDADKVVVIGHHEISGEAVPFVHVWTMRDGDACAFVEYVDNQALAPFVQG